MFGKKKAIEEPAQQKKSVRGAITAEKKPTQPKKQNRNARRLDYEQEDIAQQLRGGIPSVLDLFAPDAFDRSHNDHFKMGRYYTKTLVATAFPRELAIGWMDTLLMHRGDADVSVHVEPYSQRQAITELTQMITKIKTQQAMQRGNISLVAELQQAEADAWGIRDLITNNQSKLWKVTLSSNLYQRSLESLEEAADDLEARLGAARIHTRSMEGRMDEGFQSTSPIGINFAGDIYRNLDTWGLSTIFPFTVADMSHEEGYPFAMNYQTGAPIFYDPYDPSLINHNQVIYGSSGSGKSTTMKVQIGRAILTGELHVILDPEGEYRKIINSLNGTYIQVGNENYSMNPCDLEIDEEFDDETGTIVRTVNLTNKALDLTGLVEVAFGRELGVVEKNVLETCVLEEYISRGIGVEPETLFEDDGVTMKRMPTLSDIYARLVEKRAMLPTQDLINGFPRFLRTGTIGFLDHESNVQLRNVPIVGFDLSKLENQQLKAIGFHLVLGWVWEKFLKRNIHIKKRLIIDEGWQFIDIPECVDFIERVFRRVRKRTAGITFASQDYARIAAHPKSKAIHQNTDTFIFLKHKETDLLELQRSFDLSEGETSFLESAGKGEGIMRIGRVSLAFKVIPMPIEEQWVYTTPLRMVKDNAS